MGKISPNRLCLTALVLAAIIGVGAAASANRQGTAARGYTRVARAELAVVPDAPDPAGDCLMAAVRLRGQAGLSAVIPEARFEALRDYCRSVQQHASATTDGETSEETAVTLPSPEQ